MDKSKDHLLGATSAISRDEQRVTEVIEQFRYRSNDPFISENERNTCREWVDRYSQPNIIEILQCRHYSRNKYGHRGGSLSSHGPNCFPLEQFLIETYKDIPRGPQGFTLPTDDNVLLHMISFLDYYTAHKMNLVSKRFNEIMNTFKSIRSTEMLACMPFTLDIMEEAKYEFDLPELSFSKSWHPRYEPKHRTILCDEAMEFANEKNFFEIYNESNIPAEIHSVALRTHYARECMGIYLSFTLSAIEEMILKNDVHRNGYISLDMPQFSEFSREECHPYIRFKILSRHQVTLQEAWELFVERIICDSDEYEYSERDVPRRYLLWSLLAAADPSSIHLSHVHAGCESGFRIHVFDHIALSFVIGGEKVEVVGRIEQYCSY
ncbi:predicted protein [Chaetoceros tenuissimus]|uniref:F-box domain-containing protein n=1 Tax=Chaetoceros tenuissimus TaxID=426638 RepID=A0AAD3CQB0_9STRA|nr:predicted protein [Chaetoceros tenuissimus]